LIQRALERAQTEEPKIVENEDREITREELYRLVWAKPGVVLAEEFGISDVGLAKICKRLRVPRPPRGYWRMLEVGRRITVPRLPPLRKNEPERAYIAPQRPRPDPRPKDPFMVERIRQESLPVNQIEVPTDLRRAHTLVRQARPLLQGGQADSYGRMYPRWSGGVDRKCLNLSVSTQTLPRALRIMSALLIALEARGFKIEINERKTQCLINGERVAFYLWEKVKRRNREPSDGPRKGPWGFDNWVFDPTGELMFVIDDYWIAKKNWRDRKNKLLEDQLNDIVVGMFAAGEAIRLRNLERQEEERRQLEAERQRQELERRRRAEEERRNELDTMAALWVKSRNLRLFLDECQSSLSASAEVPSDDSRTRWLRWASAYADSVDPLKSGKLFKIIQTYG